MILGSTVDCFWSLKSENWLSTSYLMFSVLCFTNTSLRTNDGAASDAWVTRDDGKTPFKLIHNNIQRTRDQFWVKSEAETLVAFHSNMLIGTRLQLTRDDCRWRDALKKPSKQSVTCLTRSRLNECTHIRIIAKTHLFKQVPRRDI